MTGSVAAGGILLDVGLTGGIASGKSTVDGMLEMFGAQVIDADHLVHELLQPGRDEHARVVERFGQGIVGGHGQIDRKALGAIVFADDAARADLNALLHPSVAREEASIKASIAARGGGVVVTDATLLVETERYREYDRLIVVACEPSLQLSRLLAREPDMHAREAQARLDSQVGLEDRLAVADYVIETSGSLADTETRTHEVLVALHEDLETKREGRPLPDRRQHGTELGR